METSYLKINGLEVAKNDYLLIIDTYNIESRLINLDETIDFRRGSLNVSDDYWDFTKLDTLKRSNGDLKFNFVQLSSLTKNLIKLIVLKKLFIEEISFTTMKSYFYKLLKIDTYLDSKGIRSLYSINATLISNYINGIPKTYREETKETYKNAFFELIKEIEKTNIEINYKEIYKLLNTKNSMQILLERELGKTELIPREYFNSMVSFALEEIQDKKLDNQFRKEAAVIILLSQLGVRIGELRIMEVNKKTEVFRTENGEVVSALFYKTYKTIKNGSFKWTKSFLTPEADTAYDLLCNFAKEDNKEKYLFETKSGNVLHEGNFRKWILRFVARNHIKLKCINISEKKLKSITVLEAKQNVNYYLSNVYIKGLNQNDEIFFPLPHQFRVTLATILYEKGIHLDWIREHMNHLTPEMTLHYIREEETKKKNVINISEFIKEEISNGPVLENTSLLYKKIDKFILNNMINIEVDVEKIIEQLKGNKPLREKKYGFCIKSNFGRKCPKNDRIDIPVTLENHIPSCEFLNVTHNRFINMIKAINYNDKNGFIVENSREIKRLKRLIENYLSPELNELKSEISNKGRIAVLREYEHLNYIIDNVEDIEREVRRWS
jgi:integrase